MNGCFLNLPFLCHGLQPKNLVIPGASFIDGYETKRKFICTEYPREKDCDLFWQTVWDNKVKIIVLTCKLTDKCYQYWSPKEGYVLATKNFKITTSSIKIDSHYTLTSLTLITSELKPKQKRMIFHYQYTAWPRDKFPHQPDAFINFYHFVNSTYVKLKSRATEKKFPPILVHCLDGVGSSSVFCAFDICITQFHRTGLLSLPNVLSKMQEQKHGLHKYAATDILMLDNESKGNPFYDMVLKNPPNIMHDMYPEDLSNHKTEAFNDIKPQMKYSSSITGTGYSNVSLHYGVRFPQEMKFAPSIRLPIHSNKALINFITTCRLLNENHN
ncbi:hypothetical protein KQX54_003024 [Cotesia glomerata]|uniref:Uncharacterized protein n=1 Tax=Cotesia glomerata TaxID=32391 RepID=A0AAV7I4S1_COTGL|nr:hypothetical protein KQX54_003024 [Cotesia glomerata]